METEKIVEREFPKAPQQISEAERIVDLELREQKATAQRNIAWYAMILITLFTVLIFSPIIPIERLSVLKEILPTFYLAQASIVGLYFGATAWMTTKK